MKLFYTILFFTLFASQAHTQINGHRFVTFNSEISFNSDYIENRAGITVAEFLNTDNRFQVGGEGGAYISVFNDEGVTGSKISLRARGVVRFLLKPNFVLYATPIALDFNATDVGYESPPYFGAQLNSGKVKIGIEGHVFKSDILPLLRFQYVIHRW